MRILVVSDTHGVDINLKSALLAQPTAEVVIHLGDGAAEMERMRLNYPEKMFLQARGNCDWGSRYPYEGIQMIEGVKIFYTHGHTYSVKAGLYNAVCAAREKGARILLFGHTHNALLDYEEGLYIMNPGSLSGWKASYGIVDITDKGIVTNIVEVK